MQRIILDTDTASDDAVAIILALREPQVRVEAITVVAGNLPLEKAVKNALISVEMAGTYRPPVYPGMARPLLRDLFSAEFVHGQDGMGNMDLPAPDLRAETTHAVDALVELIRENPYELELITLGPLTNIAMVCLKAPEVIRKLKRITIMGSAGLGPGNITPVAEFNIFVDAEAMSIVLQAGVPLLLVGWDVSMGSTYLDKADLDTLLNSGSQLARFCVRCNQSLLEFNLQRGAPYGFDLPDPVTVTAAIYPELVLGTLEAYTIVETKSDSAYGQVVFDRGGLLGKKPNARLVTAIDGPQFKARLFKALL